MSNEGEDLPRVSLKQQVSDVLDDTEAVLHTSVIDKRDQAIAHSDAAAHEFAGLDYVGSTMLFYKPAFEPLTKSETQLLKVMARKWISHLEELKDRAKAIKEGSSKSGR
jgi:hypothetical protein